MWFLVLTLPGPTTELDEDQKSIVRLYFPADRSARAALLWDFKLPKKGIPSLYEQYLQALEDWQMTLDGLHMQHQRHRSLMDPDILEIVHTELFGRVRDAVAALPATSWSNSSCTQLQE